MHTSRQSLFHFSTEHGHKYTDYKNCDAAIKIIGQELNYKNASGQAKWCM